MPLRTSTGSPVMVGERDCRGSVEPVVMVMELVAAAVSVPDEGPVTDERLVALASLFRRSEEA